MVIGFINRLSPRIGISPLCLVAWMELSRSKYQWEVRYRKAREHNALIRRDHWFEQWEKDAISSTSSTSSRWRATAGSPS